MRSWATRPRASRGSSKPRGCARSPTSSSHGSSRCRRVVRSGRGCGGRGRRSRGRRRMCSEGWSSRERCWPPGRCVAPEMLGAESPGLQCVEVTRSSWSSRDRSRRPTSGGLAPRARRAPEQLILGKVRLVVADYLADEWPAVCGGNVVGQVARRARDCPERRRGSQDPRSSVPKPRESGPSAPATSHPWRRPRAWRAPCGASPWRQRPWGSRRATSTRRPSPQETRS
jgi:hypothetical protein